MSKSQKRFNEGRRARLKAELNFIVNALPIKCQCVYRRTQQKNDYMRGWYSVTKVHIEAELMKLQKNQPEVFARNKQTLHQINQGAA